MGTITLARSKYEVMKKRAEAYERILSILEEDLFTPPPFRSRDKIVSEFRKTGLYSLKFIETLEKSLRRSSFFEK